MVCLKDGGSLMEQNRIQHLEGAILNEACRKEISKYTIALEGWRRGLTLKFYSYYRECGQLKLQYSLENEKHFHLFEGSKGDKISEEANEICKDKSKTKEVLLRKNVPTPFGRKFSVEDSIDRIIKYTEESIGYPVVAKPTDGFAGKGVVVNIQNAEDLQKSLTYIREELKFTELIIEKYIKGEEVRVYVLNNEVLGVIKRTPANVIGDGKRSIKELIEIKNEQRKKIPHLYNKQIKLDRQFYNTIRSLGITLDSIPNKGERIFLKRISNISSGGDPVDVTSDISDDIKKVAIDASNAIPGLTHSGVDILINEHDQMPYVLEVNTKPGLGSHLFPMEGEPKDIPKAIIDYYFPETMNKNVCDINMFFDYGSIYKALNRKSVDEIEVIPVPQGTLYSNKYTVSGEIQHEDFVNKIYKKAIEKNIHGFVKRVNDKKVDIVVASPDRKEVQHFENVLIGLSKNLNVNSDTWSAQIMAGFHIEDEILDLNPEELEKELTAVSKQISTLERQYKNLMTKNEKIEKSFSWKCTKPIRVFANYMKTLSKSIGK